MSVYLSPTHPLSASLGLLRRESLAPKCRSEAGRVLGASTEPFSLLSSLPLSGGIPRGNPPGGQDGASEDPGGQISLPFDRSFLIRSGFPQPRDGSSAPAWLPGLPQGVRVRPAPPRASRGDFCRVPGLEHPALWAARFGERSGRGSQTVRGSPPLLPPSPHPRPCLRSSARGVPISVKRQFSAPSLNPVRPSPAREANWYRNCILSLLSFSVLEFHTHKNPGVHPGKIRISLEFFIHS